MESNKADREANKNYLLDSTTMRIKNLEHLYDPRVLQDAAKKMFEIDQENMELLKSINLIQRSKGRTDCWKKVTRDKKFSELREARRVEIANENKKFYDKLQTNVGMYPNDNKKRDWENKKLKSKSKLSGLENSDNVSTNKSLIKLRKKHQGKISKGLKVQKYPRCYFELQVIEPPQKLGKIIFELYVDIVPRTCENFIQLCKGVNGLSYKNTPLHRIISGYLCQGGDVTNFDGSGGKSIYGDNFEDENFKLKHNSPGIISMWNSGENTNNSKFILTFKKLEVLDGKNVVFGKIVNGLSIIYKIEELGTKIGRPRNEIIISKCGLY